MGGGRSPSGRLELFFQISSGPPRRRGFSELTGGLAGAVAASMLGARAAGLRDAFFQRLSCPEHTHTGIARRQAALLGEGLNWRSLDIYNLQRLGVLRLQRAGEPAHAGANLRFNVRFRCGLRLELTGERVDGPTGGSASTKLVDRRVAQRAIEPRHQAFVRRHLVRTHEDLRKRVLQNVFGELAITNAAFQVLQESAMVLKQKSYWGWGVDGVALRHFQPV